MNLEVTTEPIQEERLREFLSQWQDVQVIRIEKLNEPTARVIGRYVLRAELSFRGVNMTIFCRHETGQTLLRISNRGRHRWNKTVQADKSIDSQLVYDTMLQVAERMRLL